MSSINPPSVSSANLLSYGIFQYEITNYLLDILETRAYAFLHELFNLCNRTSSDPAQVHEQFTHNLDQVQNWGSHVLKQELEKIRQEQKNVDQIYARILKLYLADIFRGAQNIDESASIYAPSLGQFVKDFYVQLSQNPDVRDLKVFELHSMDRKYIFVDAMRRALHDVLEEPISKVLSYSSAVATPHSIIATPQTHTTIRTPASVARASVKTPASVVPISNKTAVPSTPNAESLFNNYVNDVYNATKSNETKTPRSHPNKPSDDDDHRTINISDVKSVITGVPPPATAGHPPRTPSSVRNPKTPGSIQREPRSAIMPASAKTPRSVASVQPKTPSSMSHHHRTREAREPVVTPKTSSSSAVPKSQDHRMPDLSNQAIMRTPTSSSRNK